MPLHTFVGFVADFPAEPTEEQPAGKELAEYVHSRLREAGFDATEPEEREAWAWDMCTREGGIFIETIVGLVDNMESTPPRQWLITNDAPIPFTRRIFGNKAYLDEREAVLRCFCETIHTAMNSDSRFSHILWYNEQTFDQQGDIPSDKP